MKRLCLLLSLLVTPAYAQTEAQCDQVRQAVAQYGYRAARAHAERTLTPQQVRAGRHAFTAPVRGLAMPSVTANADKQIVEAAPLLSLRTERCYRVRFRDDRVAHAA